MRQPMGEVCYSVLRADDRDSLGARKTAEAGSPIAGFSGKSSSVPLLRRINSDGGLRFALANCTHQTLATFDRIRVIGRRAPWTASLPTHMKDTQSVRRRSAG